MGEGGIVNRINEKMKDAAKYKFSSLTSQDAALLGTYDILLNETCMGHKCTLLLVHTHAKLNCTNVQLNA